MDYVPIAAILLQDGITTGAVYALLGMALVLVFTVTRVVYFAQGEFVTYGVLSLAAMQTTRVPGTVWLLAGMAVLAGVIEVLDARRNADLVRLKRSLPWLVVVPIALAVLAAWATHRSMPFAVQCALCLGMTTAMGPLIYRIVYQPLGQASVLTLLIASVGVHFVLVGLGLIFFGVDGRRTPSFVDARLDLAGLSLSGQSMVVLGATIALIVALWLGFDRTLQGKALRATASNPVGARLMAISVPASGALSFGIAAFIGGLCGLLIGPIVTMYYDSGLLIGLKGFVAAIVGGMASYPLTLAGAVGVGILESTAAFWASAYKEAVVFLLVLPVLLALSWRHRAHGEEQ